MVSGCQGQGWVDRTGHEAILGLVEIASIFLVLVVTRPHSLSGLGKPCTEDGRVSLYTHHTSVSVILRLTLAAKRRRRQGDAGGAAGSGGGCCGAARVSNRAGGGSTAES